MIATTADAKRGWTRANWHRVQKRQLFLALNILEFFRKFFRNHQKIKKIPAIFLLKQLFFNSDWHEKGREILPCRVPADFFHLMRVQQLRQFCRDAIFYFKIYIFFLLLQKIIWTFKPFFNIPLFLKISEMWTAKKMECMEKTCVFCIQNYTS